MEKLGDWNLVTGFIWCRNSHIGSVEMDQTFVQQGLRARNTKSSTFQDGKIGTEFNKG